MKEKHGRNNVALWEQPAVIALAQPAFERLHRIVRVIVVLCAALWMAIAPFHASFANEPSFSAAQNPNRQVITPADPAKMMLWKQRWHESIIAAARDRYCDKEMGEEIGWLVSPL